MELAYLENFEQGLAWVAGWADIVRHLLLTIGLPTEGNNITWSIIQLSLVMLSFSLAFVAARLLTPLAENWIRSLTLRPSILRALAIILRRLQIIIFALLLWFSVLGMRAATWSSRSQFLALLASLAAAWAIISISSRIIRNRSVSRLVEVGGWVLVTLSLLGILPEAIALLDSLAIEINALHISLLTLIQGAVVLTVLIWGAGALSHIVEQELSTFEDLSPTVRVLVSKLARFSLIAVAVLAGLYTIGVDFTALTFISGAVGVGLGFGLQKVVSNLVSGIILLLDKSIKPGDVITVGETFGWITSLNARYASVSMRDGREILIPNEDLITQQVQNWSFHDSFVRIEINFGISYNNNPHIVREIAVEAASQHARVIKGNDDFPVACHIVAFGDSSIDFILRFFIDDPVNGITNVRGDVFLALWDSFKANDIAIPYPHREIIMHQAAGKSDPKTVSK